MVSERATDMGAKPTRYLVVVLSSSQLLNSQWPQLCFLPSKRNEADRILDPPRPENCFRLNYLAAAAFERAVKRDLYRAAAFLCNAPFCTALSMVEIVIGKSS